MWYIERKRNPESRVFFLTDEEYFVGRKDCNILIENDASISRKHAQFTLSVQENCQSKLAMLTVKDLNSKYGTCVSGKKLDANQSVGLNNNDIISFGKLDAIWRVIHQPLIVTTSCLSKPDKIKLTKLISKLGGHVVSEYMPSCSYVVMNSIMITVKTVCALASMKNIVLASFFSDMIERFTQNNGPSDPNEFLPPIGEASLQQDNSVSFAPDEKRPKLFKDRTFIFFDVEQEKRLKPGLKFAGGKSEILDIEGLENLDSLVEPGICVMSTSISRGSSQSSMNLSQSPNMQKVRNFLKQKKKRIITESEIGLAIINSSTEKYCNSDFKMGLLFFESSIKLQAQSLTQQTVMAPETQSTDILRNESMNSEDNRIHVNPIQSVSKQLPKEASKESFKSKEKDFVKETGKIRESESYFNAFKDECAMMNSPKNTSEENLKSKAKNFVVETRKTQEPKSYFDTFKDESAVTNNEDIETVAGIDESGDRKLKRPYPEENATKSSSKRKKIDHTEDEAVLFKDATKKKEIDDSKPCHVKSNFLNTAKSHTDYSKQHRIGNASTNEDENIPNNVLKIKYVDLLDKEKPSVRSNAFTQGKNFKKFKRKHNAMVCNFTELVAYVKKPDKIQYLDYWCNENGIESQKNDYESDVEDKFNWDAPLRPKKRITKRKL